MHYELYSLQGLCSKLLFTQEVNTEKNFRASLHIALLARMHWLCMSCADGSSNEKWDIALGGAAALVKRQLSVAEDAAVWPAEVADTGADVKVAVYSVKRTCLLRLALSDLC